MKRFPHNGGLLPAADVNILVMGGTRFVGKPLVEQLLAAGHSLTLFTRGRNPVPAGVEALVGDRGQPEALAVLEGRRFDVIVDSSGRTLDDSRAVVERTGPPAHRFVYVSSAGVYADSAQWPLDETSPWIRPAATRARPTPRSGCAARGFPSPASGPPTSWGRATTTTRSRAGSSIASSTTGRCPSPGDGSTITQLGHVKDLAAAMARCLEWRPPPTASTTAVAPRG